MSTTPDPHAQPVKPALKMDGTTNNNANKKELSWDEVAIEEHDQLRGTRMKIDEPNTPYTHYDSGSETDGSNASSKKRCKSPISQKPSLSWDSLQTKLNQVAAENEEEAIKKLQFREHRKQHYNEMEAVRKFRLEHQDDDNEDDLADDEGEN